MQMSPSQSFSLLVLLLSAGRPCHASMPFAVDADLPQMGGMLAYKTYRDAWVLPIDTGVGEFTLALPQTCVDSSDCSIKQTSFEPLTCKELKPVLLDPKWFNSNIQSDFSEASDDDASWCPRSFADMADAQALLGSITAEPFLYMTFPTTVVVRNKADLIAQHAFLDTFNEVTNTSVPRIVLRVLFIDQIELGHTIRFSLRQVSVTLELELPVERTLGTVQVSSACKALGLVAPERARLEVVGSPDNPTCSWNCHLGYLKTPWNEPPSFNTSGECKEIPKEFTLVEFSFAIATQMPSVGAPNFQSLLSQDFFDELDKMAAALTDALPIDNAMVVLKVKDSVYDYIDYGDLAAQTSAWMHRQDLMIDVNNASLVVAALQRIGLYERYDNPDHSDFSQFARRRTVHQIPVEGMLVTSDTRVTTTFVSAVLRNTITPDLHKFPSYFQVEAIELADVKSVHVSGPQQKIQAPSAQLQRAASNTMVALVMIAIVMVSGCAFYTRFVRK